MSSNWGYPVLTTALILAGHGSHISPNTAGLVWQQVDRVRGSADEVTAAFWKEMPSFHTVFNSLTADDITVVPLFTARGYFTQTVIPAEMGLTGMHTSRDGRTIRYARTLGEHPALMAIVLARVDAVLHEFALPPDQTAVAVIGHSTRRAPESRQATEAAAQAIRAARSVAQVEAVYLDDSPAIPEIFTLTRAKYIIAVPFFLASGSHTTIDVPAALSLPAGASRAVVNGRNVFYTDPVGTDNDLANLIVTLAQEAGAPLYPLPPESAGGDWHGFPRTGRALLIDAVSAAESLRFGGLHLSLNAVYAWNDPDPRNPIRSPAELRARVRTMPFRSLATSDDLPTGWHVPITSAEQLHAVVETIYPGALGDWSASTRAEMGTFAATVARQTGMYRQLASLTAAQQRTTVERVCGRCVRQPKWCSTVTDADEHQTERLRLPCPEPCNHWLSAALEELL
jgi:sirohydrochlorin cobaltochelatase